MISKKNILMDFKSTKFLLHYYLKIGELFIYYNLSLD